MENPTRHFVDRRKTLVKRSQSLPVSLFPFRFRSLLSVASPAATDEHGSLTGDNLNERSGNVKGPAKAKPFCRYRDVCSRRSRANASSAAKSLSLSLSLCLSVSLAAYAFPFASSSLYLLLFFHLNVQTGSRLIGINNWIRDRRAKNVPRNMSEKFAIICRRNVRNVSNDSDVAARNSAVTFARSKVSAEG